MLDADVIISPGLFSVIAVQIRDFVESDVLILLDKRPF
jgi:hypothetical protein